MYDPNDPRQGLPKPPPSFDAPAPYTPAPSNYSDIATPQLPSAPPSKRGSLFDKEHRQDTLLAIGTGLLGGFNFGDGLAAAGQNVMGLKKQLRSEQTKEHAFGGPDNSFDITTDPRTGARTVAPVQQFQDYLEAKRTKQKDVADINGRAMYAVQTLPEGERAGAYAHMMQNPSFYGIDPRTMPAQYDPVYAHAAAGMGQTVAQATAGERAVQAQQNLQGYRQEVQTDRQTRTDIYRDRAAATTRQSDTRLAQGAERIGITRANAGRKGGGGTKSKINPANNDLSYLQ